MTDLEMVKACAEAMGLDFHVHDSIPAYWDGIRIPYDPLHNDAQAMALVERFKLELIPNRAYGGWWVTATRSQDALGDPDLKRAIVRCVANMQASK
jgi:hypothetical protein